MCEKYDVAIIGGGVIGSSVAHFLAERGHKVAIVEKQSIASEASKQLLVYLVFRQNGMRMIRYLNLLEKAELYFHNLQQFYVKRRVLILDMKKKEFIVLLKMKMRRKRILHIMDWQQKTGEDSYFLTGDHVREKSHIYPNLL